MDSYSAPRGPMSQLKRRIARLEGQRRQEVCPVCSPAPGVPMTVEMILTRPRDRLDTPSPPEPEPVPPPPCPRCGRVPEMIVLTLDLEPPRRLSVPDDDAAENDEAEDNKTWRGS